MNKIEGFSYAKINLFFEVLYKREDGYHEVRTIMNTIDIKDKIVISKDKRDSLKVINKTEDPTSKIPDDKTNIVYKALELFREYTNIKNKYSIILEKNIPSGAGLGGGSSNAANFLLLLNRLEGNPLNFEELLSIGENLGSDVNFFFYGGSAICLSKGEVVEPIPLIKIEEYMYVVKPYLHISTKDAYGNLKKVLTLPRKNTKFNYFLNLDYRLDRSLDLSNIYNCFEEVIYDLNPELGKFKIELENIDGVKKVWLTGSGAALVVLSDKEIIWKNYLNNLSLEYKVYKTRLIN